MKKVFYCVFTALVCTASAFAEETHGSSDGMTHHMVLLVMQLGVILIASRLGNILFEKLKLSGVLGEVVSGIIIGPYLLGRIPFSGFAEGLFPMGSAFPVSFELYGLCAIAAVVLLFSVGLETDLKLLLHYSLAGTLVGIGGVVFSFMLGDLVTVMFSKMLFGVQYGFFDAPCLFLGVISTATSVGITARILSDKKKLDSPEGVTTIAGAVIDDVIGIIILAVVFGVISARKATGFVDWGYIGIIAAKAMGVWLGFTVFGFIMSRRISFLLKLFRDRFVIGLMGLGLAMILSGIFEQAGLAMIVGAYVMGISLSQTDIAHVVREKIKPIYGFLVPVFFCVMGMLIDFHALASKEILIFGLIYSIVAILSKVVGCGAPALLAGFNLRGAARIGVGMTPRCEIALTIAGIGLARGVISQEVVGIAVILMMVTTISIPPILQQLFKSDLPGTRKSARVKKDKVAEFDFPSVEVTNLLLSKLLGIFESEGFFVHLLDRRQGVYQLRKDDMIIGLHQPGTTIRFHCREDEIPLVNTAMCEVVAELEQIIESLRSPIDEKAIARRMQESRGNGKKKTGMTSCLKPGTLLPTLKAETKEDVIDELLALLEEKKLLNNVGDARKAVMLREKSLSTGMQYGIAIPHGRTDAVKSLVCAVGIKPEGIDFEAIDGNKSNIFVLTLSPKSSASPHMQFMSMISQTLNEAGREKLLSCKTSGEMYKVFS